MADIRLSVTTTKDYTCVLSREELIQILNRTSVLAHQLPADTEITVTVPHGSDFSGDSLALEDAGGLTLTWREVIVK